MHTEELLIYESSQRKTIESLHTGIVHRISVLQPTYSEMQSKTESGSNHSLYIKITMHGEDLIKHENSNNHLISANSLEALFLCSTYRTTIYPYKWRSGNEWAFNAPFISRIVPTFVNVISFQKYYFIYAAFPLRLATTCPNAP